jgi:hypothetical protein
VARDPLHSRRRRQAARRRAILAGSIVAGLVLLFAVAVAAGVGDGPPARTSPDPVDAPKGPMGGRIIDITGDAVGRTSAGGIEVVGADWELGRVPLMVTVEPTWTLQNTSGDVVALGQPHAEVLDGCCPGPLALGASRLGPGESTDLTFPLQMHPGMDGPHDFDVHVPVTSGGATHLLTLGVTGDFRD